MPKLRRKTQVSKVFIIHHQEPSSLSPKKLRHILNRFVPDGRPYEIQYLDEETEIEGHRIVVNVPPDDAEPWTVAEIIMHLHGAGIYIPLDAEGAAQMNDALGFFIEKFLRTPSEEDPGEKPPEFYRFTKEGLMAHDERVIDQALADFLQRMKNPTNEALEIAKQIVEEAMDEGRFVIR